MHVQEPVTFGVMLVLSLALWLWVTVDVRGRADLSVSVQRRWIVAAFVFPVLVSVLYLAVGRRRSA